MYQMFYKKHNKHIEIREKNVKLVRLIPSMRNHWRYFYTNICLLFVKKCDILCHMGKEGKDIC